MDQIPDDAKPEHEEYIRKSKSMINELNIRINKRDWKDLYTDKSKDLYSWIRNTDEGLKSLKVQVDVEGSMENVLRVLNENHKYRSIYDPSFESQKYLQKINDFVWMNYTRIKKVAVISGRDVILVLYFTVDENGIVYVVVYSVEREDLVPIHPNYVRAALPIGGWKLEPRVDKPGKICITYCVEMDVKGNLPQFLLSTAMKDQAKDLAKLRDLVAELEKQNKSSLKH
jgi:hypothetical protein